MRRISLLSLLVTIFFVPFAAGYNSSVEKRLIGGYSVRIESCPHHAAIFVWENTGLSDEIPGPYSWKHHCGATLVQDHRWAVTAAHCLYTNSYKGYWETWHPNDIRVATSRHFLPFINEIEVEMERHKFVYHVKWLSPHYEFKMPGFMHDIGVIRLLHTPEQATSTFRPIDLYKKKPPVNVTVVLCGFGSTSTTKEAFSIQLKAIELTLKNTTECEKYWKLVGLDHHVCLFNKGERGAIYQDRGSGYVLEEFGQHYLVGVQSERPAQTHVPPIVTSVYDAWYFLNSELGYRSLG